MTARRCPALATVPPPDQWHRLTPAQAREIQSRLRDCVVTEDALGPVRRVAGVDVGFPRGRRKARAAVAVLGFPGLELLESAVAERAAGFPYVPGLLSFREIPAAVAALRRLKRQPDLLLCDGQGLAHPRRFGLACHLGVLLDRPTIGVAKSRLLGEHDPVPDRKGAWVPLYDGDEVVGAVLRTRAGVRPLYVSIGHRVSLGTAVDHVMACVTRYRLPETTRRADHLASRRPRAGRSQPA